MSSAQEQVLKALTVAILLDLYTRLQDNLIPSSVSWLIQVISHNEVPDPEPIGPCCHQYSLLTCGLHIRVLMAHW